MSLTSLQFAEQNSNSAEKDDLEDRVPAEREGLLFRLERFLR